MSLRFLLLFLTVLDLTFSGVTCPSGYSWCASLDRCINPDSESCVDRCPSTEPFECDSVDCAVDPGACCDPGDYYCYRDQNCYSLSSNCLSTFDGDPMPCSESYPIRCADGRCVECDGLCEPYDCGEGMITCYDRSCEASWSDCKCPADFKSQHRCDPQTECVVDPELCLLDNFCPGNRPTKCDDNQCYPYGFDCSTLNYTGCDTSTNEICEDKTCAPSCDYLANGCTSDKPIRCLTGECVADRMQCPDPYVCVNTQFPHKCIGGLCVKDEYSCPALDVEDYIDGTGYCPPGAPYLCEIGLCVAEIELCPAINPCPCGQTRRADGTCRDTDDTYGGNTDSCPPIHPIRCLTGPSTGMCVDSEDDCATENGCPSKLPVKCSNGVCVASADECPSEPSNGCPDDMPVKCANGACVAVGDEDRCRNSYACPEGQVRCYDGTCTSDPSECEGTVCHGYLCSSLQCVSDPRECWNWNPNGCTDIENPHRCADGSCVASWDQCQPVIYCDESNPIKCWDGTCVSNADHCPAMLPCPDDRPTRCWDGTCIAPGDSCSSTCPDYAPYRCVNGACVSSEDACPDYEDSHCPHYTCYDLVCADVPSDCSGGVKECADIDPTQPYRCWDGQCVSSMSKCEVFPACPDDTPIRCGDGSCVSYNDECGGRGEECKEGEIKCPDGSCQNYTASALDEDTCGPYMGCPSYLPIYCPDFSCTDNEENCYKGCSTLEKRRFRCHNGTCVDSEDQCAVPAPATRIGCKVYVHDYTQFRTVYLYSSTDDTRLLGDLMIDTGDLYDGDQLSICTKPDSWIRQYTKNFTDILSTIVDVEYITAPDSDFRDAIQMGLVAVHSTLTEDEVLDGYCLGTVDEDVRTFNCVSPLKSLGVVDQTTGEREYAGDIERSGVYFLMAKNKTEEKNCPLDYVLCDDNKCAANKLLCSDVPPKEQSFSPLRFATTIAFASMLLFVVSTLLV